MCHAVTAVRDNRWALFSSPAMLASVGTCAAVCVSPSPFGLKELSTGAAVYNHALPGGAVAIGMHMTGFELYAGTCVSLSGAYRVGPGVSFGVTASWQHVSIASYGSDGFMSLDVGAAVEPVDGLVVAARTANVNQPHLGERLQERLPLSFSLGAACALQPDVQISMDVANDVGMPFSVRSGIAWAPISALVLRIGAGSEPGRFAAGFRVSVAAVSLDYAVITHPDLGAAHTMTLGVAFERAGSTPPGNDTN